MGDKVGESQELEARRIADAYSDEFLTALSAQFGFDFLDKEIAQEIRRIGHLYFAFSRLQGNRETQNVERADYTRLKDETEKFIALLTEFEARDIATDIFHAALANSEPSPKTEFPDLSAHQKRRGEPFLRELVRLLNLLKASTEFPIEYLAPNLGRPKDTGLELFVQRAADIWVFQMGRKFTIDYFGGSGLTPAFEYVRALLKPLADIPEKQIITAMRAEVTSRRR